MVDFTCSFTTELRIFLPIATCLFLSDIPSISKMWHGITKKPAIVLIVNFVFIQIGKRSNKIFYVFFVLHFYYFLSEFSLLIRNKQKKLKYVFFFFPSKLLYFKMPYLLSRHSLRLSGRFQSRG